MQNTLHSETTAEIEPLVKNANSVLKLKFLITRCLSLKLSKMSETPPLSIHPATMSSDAGINVNLLPK